MSSALTIGDFSRATHLNVKTLRYYHQIELLAASVHPGTINNPMFMTEGTYRLFRPDLENPTADDIAEGAQALNALPVPWLEPADVSDAVLWLASDEARYVTGVTLPVDAGQLAK